ncbi:MAG TPA: class I SAM-dependent methyltransferase family protein [archaeon]|nr:class I SAM-dependent methyltransferase family protein [archaeon]
MSGILRRFIRAFKEIFLEESPSKPPIKSYDVIGSREKAVAIIDVPEKWKKKEVEIAESILKTNKNIRSVLKKSSKRKGKLRLREYELLLGDRNTKVVHKEYGCLIKVDPQKAYFSPREGTERSRLAEQVKAGETVMVMFSGVCPYAIQIAKKQPRVKKILAIEMNPDAVEYAIENIKLNKIHEGKIIPILDDVKDECPNHYGACDRVIMPLPTEAQNYLDIAVKCLQKEGGIIHYYSIGPKEDPYSKAAETVDKVLKKLGKRYEILSQRKVLPYAPRIYKICMEIKVY